MRISDWSSDVCSSDLIVLFLFTSFMSLVYAPLFVFGCGWHGLTLGPAGPCGDSWVGRAWLGYVQMEPIYHDAPVWLQLVNELDMFFFSWFYVLSVIVFVSKDRMSTRLNSSHSCESRM